MVSVEPTMAGPTPAVLPRSAWQPEHLASNTALPASTSPGALSSFVAAAAAAVLAFTRAVAFASQAAYSFPVTTFTSDRMTPWPTPQSSAHTTG